MAMYQTGKQITKFTISGIIAVLVDFAVYYGLSNLVGNADDVLAGGLHWNDFYKGFGFLTGTFVSYNLNKFWTWRTSDRNNKRLANFTILYLVSLVVNIIINKWGLHTFLNNEIALLYTNHEQVAVTLFPFKTDKLFAFVLATGVSSVITFIGQKLWVFKDKKATDEADSE
ncbi:MAG: putative flippase GtrA [Bacteroidia bacterium]|jgi:putative flippase GtrA